MYFLDSRLVYKPALISLQWRHNERDGVSKHQPHDCLLNRIFKRRSKKTSKLRVTGFVLRIPRWPVNSPHERPVTPRKMFPFDDVIMYCRFNSKEQPSVLIEFDVQCSHSRNRVWTCLAQNSPVCDMKNRSTKSCSKHRPELFQVLYFCLESIQCKHYNELTALIWFSTDSSYQLIPFIWITCPYSPQLLHFS